MGHFVGDLNWQIAEDDIESVYEIAKAFEVRMVQNGMGRIKLSHFIARRDLANDEGTVNNARHHMGATRMSNSPRDGVVDGNCLIHGLRNCYIAGASVFPTYDWPGPTFTAIALSLRLADHLKKMLSSSGQGE